MRNKLHPHEKYNQNGSVLIMVVVALWVVGILLGQMTKQVMLDDRLTDNFIKVLRQMDRHCRVQSVASQTELGEATLS